MLCLTIFAGLADGDKVCMFAGGVKGVCIMRRNQAHAIHSFVDGGQAFCRMHAHTVARGPWSHCYGPGDCWSGS